jgi:phosphate ABC transporter phosphate-binding protein
MKYLKWMIVLTWCLLAGSSVFARQATGKRVRKLYVEAFSTKANPDKLRDDVMAELNKLSSVSIVSVESDAELVLGGGGEIWIRGYRSFSPRSELKLPTNGTPIYGGYLAVELKNKQGITVWSYLVTPAAGSANISKDLARRIVQHLQGALNQPETLASASPQSQSGITLNGAGATFPYPVYSKWFANYGIQYPGVQINYDAIGSEAGVRKLLAGTVDFAASDSPNVLHEISPGDENNYLLFPSVVGAVVPIVNLPGVPRDMAFTPEALAGIYLGKIKKWNDPILRQINRNMSLPDLDIVVVHRADGSGTSYAWTDYLSRTSADWRNAVGAGLAPKWPTGLAAAGNEGVAGLVKEQSGAIGYVEFIYALQHHIAYGKVRNQNGEFVEASLESIASAVRNTMEIRDDIRSSIVDAPGEGSYPIASFTWIVVPSHIADDSKRTALIALLRWMLGPGQKQSAALGYLALPKDIVGMEEDAIARIH